ncbi:MAG: YfhO family protein [Bacilli bacterium]|nr:YfhO family protein [Bacilli bacterium]
MKKLWQKVKIKKYSILSFLLPIILLLTYFLFHKISYKDLFVSDLQEQYSNFFYYLKNVLEGKESLFYSFHKGMGGEMLGTFFYYLSSPLNLLLIIIPKSYIFPFIIFLILFKIGLSSFTMHLFLKNIFHKQDIGTLLFSLLYALMGYTTLYYFNIMWLDIVYLAPLVLYGIDRVVEGKSPLFYIIFLSVSIISQYYMAYMLCIMCVVYFLYKIFITDLINKKTYIIRFIISTILSVLLCSIGLSPIIKELLLVDRVTLSVTTGITDFKIILEFLQSFFLTRPSLVQNYQSPVMYFTILGIFLVCCYFLNPKINKKEKRISGITLGVLCLGYVFPFINFVLHGFSNPAIFNYRYSFLVVLFLCRIAYISFSKIKEFNIKKLWFVSFLLFLLYIVATCLITTEIPYFLILLNLFFIFSYHMFFKIIIKYQSKKYQYALFFLCIIELFLHLKLSFITNQNFVKPYHLYDKNDGLCYKLEQLDPYYRIEGELYSSNEDLICGNSKISAFISTNNKKERAFLEKVGFEMGPTYIKNHYGNMPLMNSLLGVKYFYSKQPVTLPPSLQIKEIQKNSFYLYQNDNALSLGYAFVPGPYKKTQNENLFLFQNNFTKYLGGDSVFDKVNYQKIGDNKYEIIVENDDPIYLYYNNSYNIEIYMDGKKMEIDAYARDNTGEKKKGVIPLYNLQRKQKVVLEIKDFNKQNQNEFYLYTLNIEKYNKIIERLKENSLEITSMQKNKVEGNLHVDKDKMLLMTIPYSKNFTAYIDGKEVETKAIFDTFLGIQVPKGKHHITFIYKDNTVWYGVILSGLASVLTIFYLKQDKKMYR